jgi:copper(I)-binding protein
MLIGIFRCWCNKFFLRIHWFAGITLLCNSAFALADLQISGGWVKLAPPGAKANAAYLQFYNPTKQAVVIESINAHCCAHLMLHRTRYENDRAIMEHVDQLTIPAQSHVELIPGGLHIMLINAVQPLIVGDTIEMQLHFNNGQQQTIHLPVKADGP